MIITGAGISYRPIPLIGVTAEGIKWQTTTPHTWEELPEILQGLITNGCGGKGSIIKPPHSAFHEASCDHHDYGFWKGGSIADFKKCNTRLREAMQRDCKRLPWYKQPMYRPWCGLYYKAVSVGGEKYFQFRDYKIYPDLHHYRLHPEELIALLKD